jgi:hypothetical protein
MKKYISIILICTLIFNATLYLVFVSSLINRLKERFDDEDSDKSYEINKIFEVYDNKPGDFILLNNREIKADGEMFDILKIEKKEGKTVYYCYHDKEEEYIQKNLDNSPTNKSRQRHSFQLQSLTPFVVKGNKTEYSNSQVKIAFPSSTVKQTKMVFYDILTPPPKFCFHYRFSI